jgi:exopolysaccharide production protein ExoQ
MKKILQHAEHIFAVLSLFFFSQGFFGFFLQDAEAELNPDSGSVVLRSIAFGIYLITLLLLAFRWEKTYKVLSKNRWILFLLCFAAISTLWSSAPDMAFKKVYALIGTTLFGIYLGSHYEFDRQLKLIGWSFGISIVLSFGMALLFPEYGIMNTNAIVGAWKGIYMHKSTLGENMFISFLTFYFLAESDSRYRLLCYLACALSTFLVVLSWSGTSMIALVSICLLATLLKFVSLQSKAAVSVFFLFLFGIVIAQICLIFNLSDLLDAGNKDITISGRTPLWESLWEFIQLKIWTGYGYGSFFSPGHAETEMIWKGHSWAPLHAHNGYIQLMAGLGIVGTLVFVSGYFYSLGRSLISYLLFKDIQKLCIFSFLFYTVVFNLTEVSFLSPNHLNWVLSVAYIYLLSSSSVIVSGRSPHKLQLSVNRGCNHG